MNALALLADANGASQIEQIAKTFGVDWPHLIAQIISFGIVSVLLHRFAYRPVLAMLEERRQKIAEGLTNADKIKAELARTEAKHQEMLTLANAQGAKLIEDARTAAARILQQETEKAIATAEQIIQKAREATIRERDRMLAELKRDVGRLIVLTTAAVTGKILTPDDQQRLAEDTARQLAN
ncbi:MAG: F0F1 ATP synthase subunit B [Planctomycetes bacterium]|nr:F0F1 ATP synthase subunit B [Planctomycetota bacterium]